jgi:hypothetical protein
VASKKQQAKKKTKAPATSKPGNVAGTARIKLPAMEPKVIPEALDPLFTLGAMTFAERRAERMRRR